ncbi:MAG: replication and repair protein RecO [Chloroflexi bacterium]|nr:replication and repair protein RecO [Chloroflexota bacterium]
MPEPRYRQTEAIIIRKIKLGEADRILTLFTPEYGKIEAVAKGVRRPKSKMAGHLELLTYSQIRLAHGRNLDTIIGSQTIDSFMSLKNDLWLTSYGLYAAELVNQFSAEHQSNPPLFRLLLETLRRLSQADNQGLVLRYFELRLLELAGYRPQLQECVACRVELKPEVNAFCSSAGGILCPECRSEHPTSFPISVDALKVLRLFQRSDFESAERLKISPELSGELQAALANYIHFLLEREVKSATWLDAFRAQLGPAART